MLSSLASLRHEGADRLDPVRFHYMERLGQRMQAQPQAVRQILACRLQEALNAYIGRVRQWDGINRRGAASPRTGSTPLAELNRYIHSRTQGSQDSHDGFVGGDGVGRPEMKSVRSFSEVWSKIAAENQVDQAVGRGPENAGPLNSHMLMLRSLTQMRDLSPEYLRRFLAQMDALLWLEQVNKQYALTASKPVRRGRQNK